MDTKMNDEPQTRLSSLNFRCTFCGYASKLDLTECPDCGRLKRCENRQKGEPTTASRSRVDDEIRESFANALPIAEIYVYECAHCRYQTSRALWECPECGRSKVARIAVSARRNNNAGFRQRHTPIDKSRIGKVLMISSIGFFWVALLIFLGRGPSGPYRRTEQIAAVGENWVGALILGVAGIAFIIVGIYLKNKD